MGAQLAVARVRHQLLQRLVSHPRYGATIALFLNHGVMRRRDKRAAFVGMGVGYALLLLLVRPAWPAAVAVASFMAGAALWIERRPEHAPEILPDPQRHDLPPR